MRVKTLNCVDFIVGKKVFANAVGTNTFEKKSKKMYTFIYAYQSYKMKNEPIQKEKSYMTRLINICIHKIYLFLENLTVI